MYVVTAYEPADDLLVARGHTLGVGRMFKQLGSLIGDIPSKAFLPFGAGPHKCIGDALAWAELVIVLATLCARWRLRPAPGHKVTAVPSVVPRPDSLLMVPEPLT